MKVKKSSDVSGEGWCSRFDVELGVKDGKPHTWFVCLRCGEPRECTNPAQIVASHFDKEGNCKANRGAPAAAMGKAAAEELVVIDQS